MTVLIHPSLGRNDGRVRSKISLAEPVDFASDPLRSTLSEVELAGLMARNPEGRARFWGTYPPNYPRIRQVSEGDYVLFTGQSRVWAIGEMGYRFDNRNFASALWPSQPDKGVYEHVYALSRFEPVSVSYADVNRALGNKLGNNFQQMTVVSGRRADDLVEALRLDPPSIAADEHLRADERLAELLAPETGARWSLDPVEAVHATSTAVTVPASERIMRRGEGSLVVAYVESLTGAVRCGRSRTDAGVTDLQIHHEDRTELVEAKAASSREYVRQALAQLLHYAPSLEPRPDVASALFPDRPAEDDVQLLHRYGIDCIFRTGAGAYERLSAPGKHRALLRSFWA